ncbi:MAG: hypothetical protein J7L92_06520 [Dehalococcoidia bacterium]|nr:hypothetical protein [Dehalococcoidia bacterium]
MAKFPVTDGECAKILAASKVITADVVWTRKHNKSWATSVLPVENDLKYKLEVILTASIEEPSKFSFTLLLNGNYRIRGLDINGSHYNKCSGQQRWVGQTHKHTWQDSCPGGHAYTPIEIDGTGINETFVQFCRECNIDFRGNFKVLTGQSQLVGI